MELFCAQTPKTCKNFLALAASGHRRGVVKEGLTPGYYDNTNFHRNIKGFMIQAPGPSSATVRPRVETRRAPERVAKAFTAATLRR